VELDVNPFDTNTVGWCVMVVHQLSMCGKFDELSVWDSCLCPRTDVAVQPLLEQLYQPLRAAGFVPILVRMSWQYDSAQVLYQALE